MNYKSIIISFVLASCLFLPGFGANEVIESYLPQSQYIKGGFISLTDSKIYGPTGYNSNWQQNFGIKETMNSIELFVNTSGINHTTNPFKVTFDLKFSYRNSKNTIIQNNQGKDTTEISLSVAYNKNGRFTDRDIYTFKDGHQVYIELENITLVGIDSSSVNQLVFLKTAMQVERYYKMANQPVNNLYHSYDGRNNELYISWKEKKGAEQYDVEWTWVDNYDFNQAGNMQRLSKSNVKYDFEENSQRVRIANNHYTLPVVYEEGYLIYRVRPLAKTGSSYNKTIEGPWTLQADKGKVSNAGQQVYTVGSSNVHEKDKKNWMYYANFTGNGKSNSSVNYYDGIFYNRQHVQQLNTINDVLIGEMLYDYHGRRAVDVKPAPTGRAVPSKDLHYYENFNQDQQGNAYSKKNFDKFSNCQVTPEPMNHNSGAAKYYSPQNQSASKFRDHIPDAEGYPFSQRQFIPDGTSRLRRQSKEGKKLQLGQGHDKQFFYGTPGQSELDRLFGSDVGKAIYYQKKIVVDENGQSHIYYKDHNNNVIATALAGGKPNSLQGLPSDQKDTETINENIINDRQERKGHTLLATKNIAVTTENTRYNFDYRVTPGTFQRTICGDEKICYDGIYDLAIEISDECGKTVFDTTIRVGNIQQIDENCNDNQPVAISFSSGPLSKGSYQVVKRLVMNEQALNEYLSTFEKKECIQRIYDTIKKEEMDKVDTASCIGCGKDGEIQKINTYTTDDGKTRKDTLTQAEIDQLNKSSEEMCGAGENQCQSAYEAMLSDMKPAGQYGKYRDTINNTNDPGIFPLSVYNTNNKLPDPNASWRNPVGVYRDEKGDTSYIPISWVGGTNGVNDRRNIVLHDGRYSILPQNLLSFSEFMNYWKDSWAKSLVQYHPEYCYYEYCNQFPQSNNYDRDILSTGRFKEAKDNGFVNANGNTFLLKNDPFFNQHPALKTNMRNSLDTFVNMEGHIYSAKEIAIAMHHGCAPLVCDSNVNYQKLDQCITNNSPLFKNKNAEKKNAEWTTYRTIYHALKNEIKNHQRHMYAISCGSYNGCIGLDKNEKSYESKHAIASFTIGNQLLGGNEPCSPSMLAYEQKIKRFPDGDDIYYEVEGVNPQADPFTKMQQSENYVDHQIKQHCDKCPIEQDLEAMLTKLAMDQNLTNKADVSDGITSCEMKKQMTSSNATAFTWDGNASGSELIGYISLLRQRVLTIRLYDTASTPIKWNNILFFSCLEHITDPTQYNNTQTRNFKVRAVTHDREVHWLEGITSTIDLTQCDVDKLCEANSLAHEFTTLFDNVFGLIPAMREYLIKQGKQQQAQQIPVYQNTKLISGNEITNLMSNEMKSENAEPNRNYYSWKVTSLSANKRTLKAGIYAKKGCSFTFDILDENKQFNEPFMIMNVMVNHPALKDKECELQQFVIKVMPLELQLQTITTSNFSDAFKLGEPYYIKVTNTCYTFGDCCPPSDCPVITDNYDFEGGHSGFSSGLPFSDNPKVNTPFYTIYPRTKKQDTNIEVDYQEDLIKPKSQGNIPNLQPKTVAQTVDKIQTTDLTKENETDTNTIVQPGQIQVQSLDMQSVRQSEFHQYLSTEIQQIDTGVVQQLSRSFSTVPQNQWVQSPSQNHFLLFYAGNKSNPKVWIQNIDTELNQEYIFTCLVKPMRDYAALPSMPPPPQYTFSVEAGNQIVSLSASGYKDGWKKMKGRFTSGNNGSMNVALVFNTPNDVLKWGVDNIKIRATSCKKVGCCPPISPEIPDSGIANPCVAQKKNIAESNAKTRFEEFVKDTIMGIRTAFIEDIMKPDETFTMQYTDNYYDYTLFYFDRTGNPVKIIPPKGFSPLNQAKISQVQQHRKNNTGNPVYPNHTYATKMTYNAYNDMTSVTKPDKGKTKFWYDKLGRVIAAQDAVQAANGNVYTYKLYDEVNRVTERGKIIHKNALDKNITSDYNKFEQWINQGTKEQVARYFYDASISSAVAGYFPNGQKYLRTRPVSVTYSKTYNNNINKYEFAKHFSYDIHGNINYLVYENNAMPSPHNIKRVDYEYDVISGNIHKVIYQPGADDQFIHNYQYDESNRINKVHTSRYGIYWEEDASFHYYPHGKLARIELGAEKIQGIDYAYTLQGWLKGINSSTGKASDDMGKDGVSNSHYSNIPEDVVSLALDYYQGDYKAIGGGNSLTAHLSGNLANSSEGQYNSNIRQAVLINSGLDNKQQLAYAYTFDQLNRLVEAKSYLGQQNTWQSTNDYSTSYSYDANGNLQNLSRYGEGSQMDELKFNYQPNTNRLDHVSDQVASNVYENDLDQQSENNYRYDAKGRMIGDASEDIQNVEWNRNNNVSYIVKNTGETFYFDYDPMGYRITKAIDKQGNDEDKSTYYVRGSQNEVMATYEYHRAKDSLYLKDHYIYGNYRMGTYQHNITLNGKKPKQYSHVKGAKQYEIHSHLDNVVATISDRRLLDSVSPGQSSYHADVVSASGYYPYGAQHTERTNNSDAYKYGYQGQEKDNELKGKGNSYYFTSRLYDPRLGRWLSTDPKWMKSPDRTPYAGMGNNPAIMVDPMGQQDGKYIDKYYDGWYESAGQAYTFVMNDYIGGVKINPFISEKYDKRYQEYHWSRMSNDPEYRKQQINNLYWVTGILQVAEGAGDIAEAYLTLHYGGKAILASASSLTAASVAKATWGGLKLSFTISAVGAGATGKTIEGLSEVSTGEKYKGPNVGDVITFEVFGEAFFDKRGKELGAALDRFMSIAGFVNGLKPDEIRESIDDLSNTEKIWKAIEYLRMLKDSKKVGEDLKESGAIEETIERLKKLNKELKEEQEDGQDEAYNPGAGCFMPGTSILMANGESKNIENIEKGEKVTTYDVKTGIIETYAVEKVIKKMNKDFVNISFSHNATSTNTTDHPYYVENKGWCSYRPDLTKKRYGLEVKQLKEGDICYTHKNGKLIETTIESISPTEKSSVTYNLHIKADGQTYFANGVLVHNKQ